MSSVRGLLRQTWGGMRPPLQVLMCRESQNRLLSKNARKGAVCVAHSHMWKKGEGRRNVRVCLYLQTISMEGDIRSCYQWLPPCDLGQAWREKPSPWSGLYIFWICTQAGREEGSGHRLWVFEVCLPLFCLPTAVLSLNTHRENLDNPPSLFHLLRGPCDYFPKEPGSGTQGWWRMAFNEWVKRKCDWYKMV